MQVFHTAQHEIFMFRKEKIGTFSQAVKALKIMRLENILNNKKYYYSDRFTFKLQRKKVLHR